jgi:hypothetical protein
MKKPRLTLKWLKTNDACDAKVRAFKKYFGKSCVINQKNLDYFCKSYRLHMKAIEWLLEVMIYNLYDNNYKGLEKLAKYLGMNTPPYYHFDPWEVLKRFKEDYCNFFDASGYIGHDRCKKALLEIAQIKGAL